MRMLFGAAAMMALTGAAAPPLPKPPVAATVDVADTIQGVRVADPYRWLEDPADPKVKAWVAGQNAASRAYFRSLPVRQPLFDWLMAMEKQTPVRDGGIQVAGTHIFAYSFFPDKQQPVLTELTLGGDAVQRRTVLDTNPLSAKGDIAIDWFVPSPDGRLVAVSLSQGGSEDGTLHVYDSATGREVEAPIAHVQFPTAGGSLAWTADGKGYWYTRYPLDGAEADRHFNQSAWYHVVGRPVAQDAMVLSQKDGTPRTAEIFLSNRTGAQSALASVQLGDGGEWRHYALTAAGATAVADYADKIVAAKMAADGTIYGISRKDAPNGRIMRYRQGAGWQPLVAEARYALDASANDHALAISGDRLYATAIDGGPTRLLAFTLDGKPVPVETPPVSAIGGLEPDGKGGLYFRQRSYTVPSVVMHLAAGNTAATPTAIRVQAPYSFGDIEVRRVFATSKDGTKVPITVMMKRGVKAGAHNPTLLYGYGGYGVNMTPYFLGAADRAWFDAGGIYAVANIRGGAEYGERWHSEGMLTRKQNVFDDFFASGRWLIDNKWTASDRLALMGGSNGGLLMGATVTQHPDLARAVVSEVGIYDMLRVELDPNGSFNVTEFGTVKDPVQFKALYAYSPYHHVTKGADYPAMLLTTGDNDGRVNPLHSRKFVAAMQAATGSGRPVYLRTEADAGHGMGSSLDVRVAEEADTSAFLLDQLGMTWSPPTR